jgi:hypothetical protein
VPGGARDREAVVSRKVREEREAARGAPQPGGRPAVRCAGGTGRASRGKKNVPGSRRLTDWRRRGMGALPGCLCDPGIKKLAGRLPRPEQVSESSGLVHGNSASQDVPPGIPCQGRPAEVRDGSGGASGGGAQPDAGPEAQRHRRDVEVPGSRHDEERGGSRPPPGRHAWPLPAPGTATGGDLTADANNCRVGNAADLHVRVGPLSYVAGGGGGNREEEP